MVSSPPRDVLLDSSSGSSSRRQLFPAYDENDEDSEPLSELGNSSDEKFINSQLSDYEILQSFYESNKSFEVIREAQVPASDEPEEIVGTNIDDFVVGTPIRNSPNVSLKTPEDALSTSFTSQKSIRKSLPGDGKTSPTKAYGSHKPDHFCKVRTKLFPLSFTVPVSSFYSQSSSNSVEQTSEEVSPTQQPKQKTVSLYYDKQVTRKPKQKSAKLYLCDSKSKRKRGSFGLNAGVCNHKFKKKKPIKVEVVENITDDREECSAPLLEYLQDLKNLSSSVKQIQDPSEFAKSSPHASILCESNSINTDSQSRKRKSSPLPDSNKKFFKYRRSTATHTMDERVKFVIDEGTVTLLKKPESATPALEMFDEDFSTIQNEVDSIIFKLSEDDDISELAPYCPIQKHENGNTTSFNKCSKFIGIKDGLIAEVNSTLLSPTTQMCNMTSDLALSSPTKAVRNLNNILDKENSVPDDKLYPVFYGPNNLPPKPVKLNKSGNKKKLKPLPMDQMLLDAGQKKFGATQCAECKFVYVMGDINDELLHEEYHSSVSVLRFGGWKDEQVIGKLENGRIIRILPHHPKAWLKKVHELLNIVNRDLGYYDMDLVLDHSQVYLYIMQRTIVGCVVAEAKDVGYRMLSSDTGIDLCSEIAYPIKCGVSRIWVVDKHRKCGIGRALLNCLRSNFMYGSVLNENEIAFSSPTVAGKAFATKYFNTPNFLIYMC